MPKAKPVSLFPMGFEKAIEELMKVGSIKTEKKPSTKQKKKGK